MSAVDDLLREYQPAVRFDSHEAFFAHDVRAMADNAAFRLVRADGKTPGTLIANHGGGLDLAFLTGGTYPNGEAYTAGDHFGLAPIGAEQFAERSGDYRAIERGLAPRWRNFVFGHAVGPQGEHVDSADGEVWLQYWFFYIYNDAQFGSRVDLHEGDWEMVQFRLQAGVPDMAIYAQHAYAEQQPWDRVEQDAQWRCPVVYSGRGSHASYFEAGLHRTYAKIDNTFLPLWWDAVDGRGPNVRQQLVILDEDHLPGWVSWGGLWGGTRPRVAPLDGESPPGPRQHGQWGHPAAFAQVAIGHEKRPLPTAPVIAVRRSQFGLKLRFDFSDLSDPPDRIIITATPDGEPPVTETLAVDSFARGRVTTRAPLDAAKAYTVDVSTTSAAGVPSAPPEKPIRLRPVAPLSPGRLLAPLFAAWDGLWLWIASRLARRVARQPVVIEGGQPAVQAEPTAPPVEVSGS